MNYALHKKFVPVVKLTVEWTATYVQDYWNRNGGRKHKRKKTMESTDRNLQRKERSCSSGIVIQDHNGRVITSKGMFVELPFTPLVAELVEIKDGASLVARLGLQNCWVVFDCNESGALELLVKQVTTEVEEAAVLGVLFSPRDSNVVAHVIAK
ncbi:hypothetical protein G4B88_019264 [Cannabis sativa]|uniref:RNase H type-1 domain-containing protein n=1 Tax=Cannabis sativa TaxID=3483 RepID=A0A7J6HMF8_CANSA|nr:hypothetical protein G4B88_019264 [Cannabis sativa]